MQIRLRHNDNPALSCLEATAQFCGRRLGVAFLNHPLQIVRVHAPEATHVKSRQLIPVQEAADVGLGAICAARCFLHGTPADVGHFFCGRPFVHGLAEEDCHASMFW
jgi:hypothetical protein